MDTDRKLTLIYFVLGIAAALASLYVNTLVGIAVAVASYAIFSIVIRKFIEVKKLSLFITTTAVTFFLVWLVAWILIYNL